MRTLFLVILTSMFFFDLSAQTFVPAIEDLKARYSSYQEETITTRRFVIEELIPLFEKHNQQPHFQIQVKGHSIEGRPIYLGKYGEGEIPILFWSQMHGDESTATMALLDLFNFFDSDHPDDQSFLQTLRKNFSLYFIPMLNPDGVDKFQRRNAAHIDLNRDALHLASPEAQLLKEVRDSIQPLFGFNLHDQSIYYRAGREGKQVAITFLAPVYDYEKSINDVRLRAMKLIALLRDSLHAEIPDRIGVYDDTFEPRAFGDNIQKWGTSTILIESGGYPDDPEKQYLRQLNFITLIKSLESIMTGSYQAKTTEEYHSIPQNDRKMMSLILRNLRAPVHDRKIRMDVGYQYFERSVDGTTYFISSIQDTGDLSIFDGFEEVDARDMTLIPGKWYPEPFESMEDLKSAQWENLLAEGYLGFVVKQLPENRYQFPFSMAMEKPDGWSDPLNPTMAPGRNPAFFLEKGGEKWVVQNGKLFTIRDYLENILKAWKD